MNFLNFVVATCFLVIASGNATQTLRVRGVYISEPEEGYQSPLGVVNSRNCGGAGKFIQFRAEGCKGEEVCRLPANGGSSPTELEFVPSQSSEVLGVRLVITEEGNTKVYQRPIAESEVVGGKRYIVNGSARTPKELQGKSLTIQYIIYRVEDNQIETCAEADFEFY